MHDCNRPLSAGEALLEKFRPRQCNGLCLGNGLSGNVPLGTLALRGSRRAYALVILGRDTATRGVCAGVPSARGLRPARQGLRLEQGECEQSRAGGNGNVLPAIELITDGGRVNCRTRLHVPEVMPSHSVESNEVAIGITCEDDAACRRKRSALRCAEVLERPLLLPG